MPSCPPASLSLDLDNLWSYLKIHGDPGWDSFLSFFPAMRRPSAWKLERVSEHLGVLAKRFEVVALGEHAERLEKSGLGDLGDAGGGQPLERLGIGLGDAPRPHQPEAQRGAHAASRIRSPAASWMESARKSRCSGSKRSFQGRTRMPSKAS